MRGNTIEMKTLDLDTEFFLIREQEDTIVQDNLYANSVSIR